ncbi:MAG TPA: TIM barrel protein [Tepidisphaeraceae bacterium]|jgi:hydroxypyruvate isomerase|nr:TIM barrel protein [Tepidisphaeraceae bacterium]
MKNRIKQSVCLWCYRGMKVEEMAPAAARMGLAGIDLLTPEQWGPLKEHGLICTMTSQAGTIPVGLNRKENHGAIIEKLKRLIEQTSDAGFPNVICFSGNRSAGPGAPPMSDEKGLINCAEGLKQVMALAERKKVTVCIELLNSKLDHKDYMCDRTSWGVALCKAVGSERCKLLYDIYHMQIMEGDVIQTLRDNIQHIGHIHTGGVPGRHEIDHTQELNYPAIMQALVDLKYDGYVAQEFIPAREDRIASLVQAVRICDV